MGRQIDRQQQTTTATAAVAVARSIRIVRVVGSQSDVSPDGIPE